MSLNLVCYCNGWYCSTLKCTQDNVITETTAPAVKLELIPPVLLLYFSNRCP